LHSFRTCAIVIVIATGIKELAMPSSNLKTILIVEDEPDTAEMFAQMLRLSGYRVLKTYGGVSGMKQLLHEKPDAVLLDVMMPDITGFEVLRFVRREPKLAKLPVIIVSAKSLPGDIEKGMEAGASVYLTKPVAFLELKKAVEDAVANSG
jgi:twitching motility two-component system response regulator PilH